MNKVEKNIKQLRRIKTLHPSEKWELIKDLKKIKLLTPDHANTKTAKNQGRGYLSFIMHLSPHKVSGYNMCSHASKGCAMACLNTAGRGAFNSIQNSRIRKTLYFVKLRERFLNQLLIELHRIRIKAIKQGLIPVIRLNGTSDLPWESIKYKGQTIFERMPEVQFYDYTKNPDRLNKNLPNNYHLTFSLSESNGNHALQALNKKFNVAMVFKNTPEKYLGLNVINGDEHDLRFLDGYQGTIIGLTAKGKAKKDMSGFVIGNYHA